MRSLPPGAKRHAKEPGSRLGSKSGMVLNLWQKWGRSGPVLVNMVALLGSTDSKNKHKKEYTRGLPIGSPRDLTLRAPAPLLPRTVPPFRGPCAHRSVCQRARSPPERRALAPLQYMAFRLKFPHRFWSTGAGSAPRAGTLCMPARGRTLGEVIVGTSPLDLRSKTGTPRVLSMGWSMGESAEPFDEKSRGRFSKKFRGRQAAFVVK